MWVIGIGYPKVKTYVYYMKMNIISNIGKDPIHNKILELVNANFIWSNNLYPNGFTSLETTFIGCNSLNV
jgi:hypothetical protein